MESVNQRPELWSIYNTRKRPGESIRVFPLSNWTELDIWQYVLSEDIPIPALYLAAERPVVEHDGTLIMVDDDRMPLAEGEVPRMEWSGSGHLAVTLDRCNPLQRPRPCRRLLPRCCSQPPPSARAG